MKFMFAIFILIILENKLIRKIVTSYEGWSDSLYISDSEGRCSQLVR